MKKEKSNNSQKKQNLNSLQGEESVNCNSNLNENTISCIGVDFFVGKNEVSVKDKKTSDSPRGFRKQLEEIEKEMEIYKIHLENLSVLPQKHRKPEFLMVVSEEMRKKELVEARKSQLLADEEIHKQEIKEFIEKLGNIITDEDLNCCIGKSGYTISYYMDKLSEEMIGK